MRLRVCVLVLVSVCVSAVSAFAQRPAGSEDPASFAISGSVSDRTGGALPGAIVRIISAGGGEESQAATDAAGKFKFDKLVLGTYRLSAIMQGFSESSRTVLIDSKSPQ